MSKVEYALFKNFGTEDLNFRDADVPLEVIAQQSGFSVEEIQKL